MQYPNQEECIDLIRSGKVMQAIKLYRGQMGVSLFEAKRAVESLI